MDNSNLVKEILRERFEELKTEYDLDWKDEFKILGLLLDDLSIQMPSVPSFTITTTKKE